VRLVKYRETVDPKSPPVPVLSPVGGEHPYYAEFGWSPADPSIKVPGPDTVWTASATTVAPGKPVRLTWDNGQGLIFALDISLDEFFMFDVKQSVENKTDKPVTLYPWSLVVRYGEPKAEGIYILHEGPYGVFNGGLKEFSYSDFKDNKQQKISTTGGWVGITDKYWMATLVPDQKQKVDVTLKQTGSGNELKYQIDYIAPGQAIAPGTSATTDAKLFAGAKIVRIISDYETKYGIDKFDLTIDWGWFWFFTKPLFWLLEWLYVQLGNFGLSILILTVIVKAVFFPLANKSYAAMSKMKALQPEMEKLKERYGEDRQRMNQELMQLYRREKVNPAAGCLPIVVQIPVFFALYKVLYTTIEMRHQPFYGWIKDLSAPDPLTILTGFGLFHWQVPEFLHFFNIGIWPLIMGVTMYLQQKLNPAPTDPVQARVFQFLPILFTFMLAPFAAGLVIYWAWSNTLSIAQQYTIMRRHGTPIGGGKGKPAVATAVPASATPAPAEGGGGGGKKGGKGAAKKR
jgi:YidC/Oxa1 family membrane protein insertase